MKWSNVKAATVLLRDSSFSKLDQMKNKEDQEKVACHRLGNQDATIPSDQACDSLTHFHSLIRLQHLQENLQTDTPSALFLSLPPSFLIAESNTAAAIALFTQNLNFTTHLHLFLLL
ncbi:hypothetical protein MA16_Dca016627 [Dendrobium catenatum]|uniref:Uncharacterized protein n=1 Tax=Dendrobium catenatum TaxID=906689 RepID=A0A2I0WB50_9ASPA|nr:hypothetical protein MA16_Dca016627 [Dendrobium catenatum]